MTVRLLDIEFMKCRWFACPDCIDYYVVHDIYTITKMYEGGEFIESPLGVSLTEFARDPECSNCFKPFAYGNDQEISMNATRTAGVSLAKTPESIATGELRAAVNAGLRRNNLRALQLRLAGV